MASDAELSQLLHEIPEEALDRMLSQTKKKQKLSQILQALSKEGSMSSVISMLKASAQTGSAASSQQSKLYAIVAFDHNACLFMLNINT